MHWTVRLSGLLLLIVLAAVGLWMFNDDASSQVPMPGGRQLYILKTSGGTNHVFSDESQWKQGLRRIFPETSRKWLGARPARQILTRHDSLVIWVEKTRTGSGHSAVTQSECFEAVFPDGSVAEGEKHVQPGGILCAVEFSRFARASLQVPLQLRDGTNRLPFVVDNPRPAHAAQWSGKPLPQTNQTGHTKIVLSGWPDRDRLSGIPNRLQFRVQTQSMDGSPGGWMSWNATGFDLLGNWSWTSSSRGLLELPSLPVLYSPWKLRVEGREYLSAGRVLPPTNGHYAVCVLAPRAQALGVRFLMVAGRGAYHITNGIVTDVAEAPYSAPAIVTGSVVGTNWSLRLVAPTPGIVSVCEPGDYPIIQARLRERIGGNGGGIFPPLQTVTAHIEGGKSPMTACFFEVWLSAEPSNLEAEIIATHSPAEFLIEPSAVR